jgi:hypothetical protein
MNMSSGWAYSGYNSDHGIDYTWEWDFGPSFTVGQVTFHGIHGGGLHQTGVVSYRYRPDPSGGDQTVNARIRTIGRHGLHMSMPTNVRGLHSA